MERTHEVERVELQQRGAVHEPPHAASSAGRSRVAAVDVMRGLVMVCMALDHVRDYVSGASFYPGDMERTTPAYFFTRWITHFCAPTFFLLAGVAVWFSGRRRTPGSLSGWLVARGLWLICAEFTIIRFGWSFQLDSPVRILVIAALGASMIVLAAAIHLPRWAIAASSVIMIAGHNLLDGVSAAPLVGRDLHSAGASAFDWVWSVLHVPHFPVLYPLIPWVGVMAAGYALGGWLEGDAAVRRRRLTWLGGAITVGFVVLRALDVYGDPSPRGSLHPVLSFLNTTKYPPSLLYLMMTLGPVILLLPRLEGFAATRFGGILAIFGRVPFFFYVLHLYVIHLLAILLHLIVTGSPKLVGFDLWVVYAVWLVTVTVLYPVCRWFAGVKARRSDVWLSYL